MVSLGREGLATLRESTAGESPRSRPQDHDVGSSRRQALLAAAATATDLIDTASLPPAPSVAPVPTEFMHYGLPVPRASGPTLPWNPKHGEVPAPMDVNFKLHFVLEVLPYNFCQEIGVHFLWGLADPVVAAGPSAPLSVSRGDLSAGC